MRDRSVMHDSDRFDSMILVMGGTGSGKSHFINMLKGGATVESDSLYSCTSSCQIVKVRIGRTYISVVDCPGFNDTKRSDTEVLGEIAKGLSAQYLLSNRLRLRGVLYVRDITKTRFDGSDGDSYDLFKRLVGKEAFQHVVFVTTMWDRLDEEGKKVAFKREKELQEGFWKEMIDEGSYMTRFQGSKASAQGILSQLVGDADPAVLQIQHELIEQDKRLADTTAGSFLAPKVEKKLGDSKSRIQRFRERLSREKNDTVQRKVLIDLRKAEKEKVQAESDKEQLEQKVGSDLKSKMNFGGTWPETIRTLCAVLGLVAAVAIPTAGSSCSIM